MGIGIRPGPGRTPDRPPRVRVVRVIPAWPFAAGLTAVTIAGCAGAQSALDPAGRGAALVANLFWWLVGGAIVVWIAVVLLAYWAIQSRPEGDGTRRRTSLIIGAGAGFPTVVLAVYLVFGLDLLSDLVAPAPGGSMGIAVSGEQWWWRVRYPDPGGGTSGIDLANEVRIPVGSSVQFYLQSPDVIHSFWIPNLAGKMDMTPGRITRLRVEPTRTGFFRGVCAEYCGASHALMMFDVVVMEPSDFRAWLDHQASPARSPSNEPARRGATLFLENGCGACHTVRGTGAEGKLGPDLTHVGSRLRIGAGILPASEAGFRRWITETERMKPGVHMPSFGMLPEPDLDALAAYLAALE